MPGRAWGHRHGPRRAQGTGSSCSGLLVREAQSLPVAGSPPEPLWARGSCGLSSSQLQNDVSSTNFAEGREGRAGLLTG